MNSLETKIWRFLPIVCFFLNIAFIACNVFIPFDSIIPGELRTQPYTILLNSATALAFLYLVFKPQSFYMYSAICCVNGFLNIAEGGSIFGGMLFCVGCSLAFSKGFYRTRFKVKTALSVSLVIIPLLFQLRFGIGFFLHSVLEIAILLMIQGVLLLSFRNYITALLPPGKKTIRLIDYDLVKRDYDFIRLIISGETYSVIAEEYSVSESAIKQRMKTLYKKFQVKDRNEFAVLCARSEINFPAAQKEMVENS